MNYLESQTRISRSEDHLVMSGIRLGEQNAGMGALKDLFAGCLAHLIEENEKALNGGKKMVVLPPVIVVTIARNVTSFLWMKRGRESGQEKESGRDIEDLFGEKNKKSVFPFSQAIQALESFGWSPAFIAGKLDLDESLVRQSLPTMAILAESPA